MTAHDEIKELRALLKEARYERDSYRALCSDLLEQRNTESNARVLAEETLDRIAASVTGLKSAVYLWMRDCPCSCAACQQLARHAHGGAQ